MFKKNKILAGSLAAVGAGSLVTGLGSNAVQADGSNLLKFLGSFELFRNLFYYLGLQEYKFSDMVFDHDMSLNLDSPMNEGDSIKIGKDELVATRIGDKDYNFLVWRVKDSEKIGKPIYIFDVETYSKSVVGAIVRAEKEKKATPSCVEYIYDLNRKNYNKASQLSMLKERANGIYKAFKLGRRFKVYKLAEKVEDCKPCSLEEYKSSYLVFDHDMILNLGSPEKEGETFRTGDDVLVATRIGDKDYNFLVWRVKDSERIGKPIYIFDAETYNKNVIGAIVRAEKEKKATPSCVEYICDFNRKNYNKVSQLSMLKERANGIYKAFELGKKVKFFKLVEKKNGLYNQNSEMSGNFGILTES